MGKKTQQVILALSLPVLLFLAYTAIYRDEISKVVTDGAGSYYDRNSPRGEIKGMINTCADPRAVPKKSVFYLKVHKTGSTTMRNILQRFTLKHNLTMPVTQQQHTYPSLNLTKYLIPVTTLWDQFLEMETQKSGNLEPLDKNYISDIPIETKIKDNQCEMFAIHSVFVKDEIMKIMPEDVTFIATLRHPLDQMISAFGQWKLDKKYGIAGAEDPILEFLKNPKKYDKMLPASLYNVIAKIEGKYLSYTKNYVAYEFGFDVNKTLSNQQIDNHLKHLNETFKVVVFTSDFPASLIFLKREMCWSFQDILYLHLRNAHHEKKTYPDYLLQNHRSWTTLDYKIYDMFLLRHKNLIQQGGQLFQDELNAFIDILDRTTEFCGNVSSLRNTMSPKDIANLEITIAKTRFSEEFKFTAADCIIMAISENTLFMAPRVQKYPQLCNIRFGSYVPGLSRFAKNGQMFCNNGDRKLKYNIPYSFINEGPWKI